MADEMRTLLIVDDEEENLIVTSALLDSEYLVLTAQSASEAMELLGSNSVDVLITDQRMPEMSGLELIHEVRTKHPDVVRMVLTAYTDVDVILEAVNAGHVYAYVIKPWSVEHMRGTLRQAIAWADLRREHGEMAAELARAHADLVDRNRELEETREKLLQEEKLAAVGRFAANMLHELRNYLQAFSMLAEMLGTRELDADGTRMVELMREQTGRMGEIVQDMRHYASGTQPALRMQTTRPGDLMKRVATICQNPTQLGMHKVDVTAEDVGIWIVDPGKLMHVAINLVRNAMQASPEGAPVQLRVSAEGKDLVIEVEDEGPGIPKKKRQWIFEPFHSTKGDDSSGLGLAICRWAVELHSGTIEVADAPESGGALFTVRLPRVREVPPNEVI